MLQHHLICRCCAGRMTVASATNPNICPGCEQLLVDDLPADAAVRTDGMEKEEWINSSFTACCEQDWRYGGTDARC